MEKEYVNKKKLEIQNDRRIFRQIYCMIGLFSFVAMGYTVTLVYNYLTIHQLNGDKEPYLMLGIFLTEAFHFLTCFSFYAIAKRVKYSKGDTLKIISLIGSGQPWNSDIHYRIGLPSRYDNEEEHSKKKLMEDVYA